MIKNNQLVYCKRSKDMLTVMETDLRLCIVKPCIDTERRFCFEVISPMKYVVLSDITKLNQKSYL